jgi:GNAT superfamily N-acetyltransferase
VFVVKLFSLLSDHTMPNTPNEPDVATRLLDDPRDPEQMKLFEMAYALYDQLFIEGEKDGKQALLDGVAGDAERKAPWIVAVDKNTDRVVGGTVVTVFRKRPVCTLGYHFTDKALRRRGIGGKLRMAAIEYVRNFNRQKAVPSRADEIRIFADIENPAKMSFEDILVTTAKSGLDPWGRARFWERQGLLPVVRPSTGEPFPFVVVPAAEGAEATEALDLWMRPSLDEAQPCPSVYDTGELTLDVVFWLFGATDLNRPAYPAPFNNPALDKMIWWHKDHPEVAPSSAYLDKIYSSEALFRGVLVDIVARESGDRSLLETLQDREAPLVEIARAMTGESGASLGIMDKLNEAWSLKARNQTH